MVLFIMYNNISANVLQNNMMKKKIIFNGDGGGNNKSKGRKKDRERQCKISPLALLLLYKFFAFHDLAN